MVLPESGYWTYQTRDRSIWLKKAFENTSVDELVAIFNKTTPNILHSFIHHETLLVDDKNSTWFTNKITNLFNQKTQILSIFVKIVMTYKY